MEFNLPIGGVPEEIPMAIAGIHPLAAHFAAVRQFVQDSMPLAAVTHSYHLDALADPALHANPAFEQFSFIELNELHHQVGILGALFRLEEGDPSAVASLGRNLLGFLKNREEALKAAQALPVAVQQHPLVQPVLATTRESTRRVVEAMPLLLQTIALSGIPAPAGALAAITAGQV